jgi:release factor glutamine methyltransferase
MIKKSISPTVKTWLRDAAEELASIGITSALLDAEIILAHTLRKSRTWLHAHHDEPLEPREYDIANARLALRLDRTPIAYIIGHKEFYTRLFKVTPSVLVPRPEREAIITLLKAYLSPTAGTLVDIGTGSGCLGITAKLELPKLDVTLADISRHALKVAEENARAQNADVKIVRSDLLAHVPGIYDVIIANLPYVDREWERSPETSHEPELALFADRGGLALIERLITQITLHLAPHGIVIVEADPEQHKAIIGSAKTVGLTHVTTDGYALLLQA